jgi:hypothetical protein
MYEAFDICYDYDIFDYMDDYLLKDNKKLSRWLEEIYHQEMIYPKNYIKLRNFENHDQKRLRSKVRDHHHFINMLTMMFFIKGTAFIYAGMEHEIDHYPDLFENDLVPWQKEKSLEDYIKILTHMKKDPMFTYGNFHLENHQEIAVFSYDYKDQYLLGIFNLENRSDIEVMLKDGIYQNILNQEDIVVKHGKIELNHKPMIIRTNRGQKR